MTRVTSRLLAIVFLLLFPAAIFAQSTIVCFGDSLTAGYGAEAGHSYPDSLQKLLDSHGYHYRVINKGVSGDTTKDGVARLPEIIALHPQIAVVEFGGNDGLRGLPITSTRTNLDQIVTTLQKAGIKVALAGITLPPDYGPDYIHDVNQTYTMAAQKFHVPLLPFLLDHVYGVPGAMQQDGIHATAKGNVMVAENVFALIRPMLKK
ncbi:arylesterase [Silvibacterium acidisoli]|uniref:arylesterase n=1 Tax=Acidobacteriaceae bacterium ZG23-2 TaxID=2883246 RepID=UPI00406C39C4